MKRLWLLAVLTLACSANEDPTADGVSGVSGASSGGSNGAAGGRGGSGSGGAPRAGAPAFAGRSGAGTAGQGGASASAGGSGASAGSAGSGGGNPAAGGSASGGESGGGGLPWLHVDGNAIKNGDGATVVLRGVALMDLGATEEWYGGVRPMIDRLTNRSDDQGASPGWYPTVLRLAVYPRDGEVESPLTYEPGSDEFYEELLRPTVDYARTKGLYVIIDWHYIDDTDAHVASTTAFWSYMAPKFAADSHVLFELFNEPIDDGNWQNVRKNMQTWYDTVRASAPRNLVLVGTPNWSANVGPSATAPVVGTNIAYVAHMYPYHFGEKNLRDELAAAAAAHPVFVTEWGFVGGTGDILDGTVTSYGEPFKAFLEQHGVSWTAWCASYDWYPPMFNEDFTLRVGERGMGGFVKDWLYEKRSSDLP